MICLGSTDVKVGSGAYENALVLGNVIPLTSITTLLEHWFGSSGDVHCIWLELMNLNTLLVIQ